MALKNLNIATANPNATANRAFIDALYKEKYGRYATDAEYNKFKTSTVKDVSNIILGSTISPFFNTQVQSPQNNTVIPNPAPASPVTSPLDLSNLNTSALGISGVNALFKQYYGRDATQEELNYWSNKSDAELRPKLIPNSATELARSKKSETPTGNTSSPITKNDGTGTTDSTGSTLTPEQKAALDKLNSDIDNWEGMTIEQKAILKQVASNDFTTGNKIYTPAELSDIIKTAATNAETNLAPYYEKVTGQDIQDLKNKMADIRSEASRYIEGEASSYKQKLAETKQSLRARGLTFSGTPVAQLGTEGFMNATSEGSVQQARRYDLAGKEATWQQNARDIGIAAERRLGSANLNNIQADLGTIADPYAGNINYDPLRTTPLYQVNKQGTTDYVKTGDIELDRIKELEKAKWASVSKARANIL